MEIYSIDTDDVIKAYFITGRVTYEYAVKNLLNLIDKLDIQRRFQNETFYKRLETDFQKGCITPPITLAFIRDVDLSNIPQLENVTKEIEDQISSGFILDGIQRLNTLKRIIGNERNTLNKEKYLYINVIICPSRDNLLYRMVTLNNGQKPMTARHQIEILFESIYDFNIYKFKVLTEKENQDKIDKSYKKADILNAYISFLSNTTSLDNKIIIEEKLDELIARKIIESRITNETIDFSKILTVIERMSDSKDLYNWLKNGNNLIGFVVGLRTSYDIVNLINNGQMEDFIDTFERAFRNMNVSKIKLSRERRRFASYFIANLEDLKELDSDELTLILAEV